MLARFGVNVKGSTLRTSYSQYYSIKPFPKCGSYNFSITPCAIHRKRLYQPKKRRNDESFYFKLIDHQSRERIIIDDFVGRSRWQCNTVSTRGGVGASPKFSLLSKMYTLTKHRIIHHPVQKTNNRYLDGPNATIFRAVVVALVFIYAIFSDFDGTRRKCKR